MIPKLSRFGLLFVSNNTFPSRAQELRKRPQIYFRIQLEQEGLSKWDPVSDLLKNVSLSTLPSAKLRAIVDAASELYRLYRIENSEGSADSLVTPNLVESKDLGADDFLPIFIFCVMRAEMERPCALCKSSQLVCCPSSEMYLFLAQHFECSMYVRT